MYSLVFKRSDVKGAKRDGVTRTHSHLDSAVAHVDLTGIDEGEALSHGVGRDNLCQRYDSLHRNARTTSVVDCLTLGNQKERR